MQDCRRRFVPGLGLVLALMFVGPAMAGDEEGVPEAAPGVIRMSSGNGSAVALVTLAHRTPGDMLALFTELGLLDEGVVRLLTERPDVFVVNCHPQQMDAALALVRRLDTPVPGVVMEIEVARLLPGASTPSSIAYRAVLVGSAGVPIESTISSDRPAMAPQTSDAAGTRLASTVLREMLEAKLQATHVGSASARVKVRLRGDDIEATVADDDTPAAMTPRHAWTLDTEVTLPLGVRTQIGEVTRQQTAGAAAAGKFVVHLTVRRP